MCSYILIERLFKFFVYIHVAYKITKRENTHVYIINECACVYVFDI